MPKFKITDNETGETLVINADKAPTEPDVDEIFQKQRESKPIQEPTGATLEQIRRGPKTGSLLGLETQPRGNALLETPLPEFRLFPQPKTAIEGGYNTLAKTLSAAGSPLAAAVGPVAGGEAVIGKTAAQYLTPIVRGTFAGLGAKNIGEVAGTYAGTPSPTPGQTVETAGDIAANALMLLGGIPETRARTAAETLREPVQPKETYAPQERVEQKGSQPEHIGTEAQRIQAVPGGGDSPKPETPVQAEVKPAKGIKLSTTAYRHGSEEGQTGAGTFYYTAKKHAAEVFRPMLKSRKLEFENLLDARNATGLAREWMPEKYGPETEELTPELERDVAIEAVRRGYDGLRYNGREIQDLRGLKTEKITHAAFVTPEGKIETGANHPEILDRLGVKGFEKPDSRNTPQFGFVTDKGRFITREEAAPISKASGQNLKDFEPGEPVHSNEVASPKEPEKPLSETKPVTPQVTQPELEKPQPYPGEWWNIDPNRQLEVYSGRSSKTTGAPSQEARFGPASYWTPEKSAASEYSKFRGEGSSIDRRIVRLADRKVLNLERPDESDPKFSKFLEQFGKTVNDWKEASPYVSLEKWIGRIAPSKNTFFPARDIGKSAKTVGYDTIIAHNESPEMPTHTEIAFLDEIPPEPTVKPTTTSVPAKPKTPIESLSTESKVKVKAPEGATTLRVTDSKGRTSNVSLKEANRGANVLRGVDIAKVEAGTIGKDKKFVPMKGEISVGPGAASPGDVPQAPPIVQLTENIKQQGQISPKASVGERISNALKISEQWGKGKDSVTAAMGNAAAVKQGLIDSYLNLPRWTKFIDAVGKWIGADQKSALEVRKFNEAIKKSVSQKVRQEAITNWIQADGDEAVLRQRAAASKSQFRRGYEEALKLSEAEKTLARNIGSYFDAMLQKGMDTGLLRSAVEDYVNQIWKKEPVGRKLVADLFGFGNLNPSFKFARQRIFENYFEGESAGFVPKDKSIGYLLSVYDLAFNRALSARALIKTLHEGKATDGMPISMISEPSVRSITPTEGEPPTVTLAKPNIAPEGAVTKDGRPYMPVDHWALRGWRFATQGKEGQPVLMQGDMVVHPDYYAHLKNALQRSRLRDIPVLREALTLSALAKQTKLSLSVFHLDQEGLHGLFHRVNPANLVQLDLNNAAQRGLVDHGLMVADPRAQELFSEGLSGGGLVGKIPGLGHLQTWFNDWLFREYIPRLKMTMALDALERNRGSYAKELTSGRINDDQIQALTARESNAAFGEQNYKLMGRNPTLQDFLRLGLLAPDFLESRARFVGQALKPYGREQQVALALMGATLWVTSRLMNQYLDGDPHWDKPFSFVYKGKEYRLRTVLGDVYHLVTDPRSFIYNRLSPATRAGIEGITGRDDRGIKRSSWEQLKDLASWAIPIPFQRRADQTALDSALGSMGISPKSLTARKQIYEIALDWMKDNPDPKIKAKYDVRQKEVFPDSQYKPLRTQLQKGDLEKAKEEYQKLLQLHKPQEILRAIRPFTVDPETLVRKPHPVIRSLNAKENRQFLNSLTPEQRKLYADAQKEREAEFAAFREMLKLK